MAHLIRYDNLPRKPMRSGITITRQIKFVEIHLPPASFDLPLLVGTFLLTLAGNFPYFYSNPFNERDWWYALKVCSAAIFILSAIRILWRRLARERLELHADVLIYERRTAAGTRRMEFAAADLRTERAFVIFPVPGTVFRISGAKTATLTSDLRPDELSWLEKVIQPSA